MGIGLRGDDWWVDIFSTKSMLHVVVVVVLSLIDSYLFVWLKINVHLSLVNQIDISIKQVPSKVIH